jgi:two-component system, chemotaxis family, chemotaxis protein CheY
MKILIVEDDVASRFLLCDLLAPYGPCHVAVDGKEAVEAVHAALEQRIPYDLVCLDIKMPRMDGVEALKSIRELEKAKGVMLGDGPKIIMTTTVSDPKSIMGAFNEQCEGYIIKPITEEKLTAEMQKLRLLDS